MINIFLLKYLLSEDLVSTFTKVGIKASFKGTIIPTNADNFYSGMSATEKEKYNNFSNEVVRIELNNVLIYLIFRNGKNNNSTSYYDFTKPSSIEFGVMDAQKKFKSLYKKHYTDFCIDDKNLKQSIKDIEYDVINAIIDYYNNINNTNYSKKPVQNGHAIYGKYSNSKTHSARNTIQKVSADLSVDAKIKDIQSSL